MEDSDALEQYVRRVMLEVMAVLWANGQRELHVGGLMRLLGVPEEAAALHDQERIEIDDSFADIATDLHSRYLLQAQAPAGTTLH